MILEKKIKSKYILYIIVFLASFFSASFLPMGEFFRGIVALPIVGVLSKILYDSYRDELKHQKNIDLQNKQQDFILSTSSHIADVIYDKHVIFCEEYIAKIQEGRYQLLRDGSTPQTINIGGDLVRIRQKHSAWLTENIENNLKPFENALIEIGANEHYLEMTAGQNMDDRKSAIIDKIYKSLDIVLGDKKPLNKEEDNQQIDQVINRIREILGIKIMTDLRFKATEIADNRLNS